MSRRNSTSPDRPDDADRGRLRRKDKPSANVRRMTSPTPAAAPAEQPARPSLTPVQAVVLVAALAVFAAVLVKLLDPIQAWTVGFLTAVFVLAALCLLYPPKDAARYLVGLFRP